MYFLEFELWTLRENTESLYETSWIMSGKNGTRNENHTKNVLERKHGVCVRCEENYIISSLKLKEFRQEKFPLGSLMFVPPKLIKKFWAIPLNDTQIPPSLTQNWMKGGRNDF